MTGHGEKLSRKQEDAIAALLSQPTLLRAAEACGIGERTVRRWLRHPPFAAAYLEARRQVVHHAIAQSQQASEQAILVLRAVMLSAQSPASARVAAARSILELAVKGIELDDFAAQLRVLEAQLGALRASPPQSLNGHSASPAADVGHDLDDTV